MPIAIQEDKVQVHEDTDLCQVQSQDRKVLLLLK
jgi:hypothetical protein